ncbi:MAG TPA: hypothetical protein VE219_01435 [Candidatus Sulfotelmatobacter sp.]|nr:hypothetical protein [Candidatus Sulfotelmatobacter sp.]
MLVKDAISDLPVLPFVGICFSVLDAVLLLAAIVGHELSLKAS